MPLLALTPFYLRLRAGDRLQRPARVRCSRSCLLVLLATLSRSGLLGLAVGVLVLAASVPALRAVAALLRAARLASAVVLAAVVVTRWHYFFGRRSGRACRRAAARTSAHLAVYEFVPKVLHMHPLLGLGLNNFSVYYEFVTGKTNWGPHSF